MLGSHCVKTHGEFKYHDQSRVFIYVFSFQRVLAPTPPLSTRGYLNVEYFQMIDVCLSSPGRLQIMLLCGMCPVLYFPFFLFHLLPLNIHLCL